MRVPTQNARILALPRRRGKEKGVAPYALEITVGIETLLRYALRLSTPLLLFILTNGREGVSVSRIFEALRTAQKERAAELERRRSRRLPMRVPVFVYGHLSSRRPFHERAYLQQVSDDGGLLMLSTGVKYGQKLLLINDLTQKRQNCFVVHSPSRNSSRMGVGVEFAQPCPEFARPQFHKK